MTRIQVQHGHEKRFALPATVKFVALIGLLIILSLSHEPLPLLIFAAFIHAYLCTWSARDIWLILKTALFAAVVAFVLLLPAIIFSPAGLIRCLVIVIKVFFGVEMVNIFNHTTQWNHITSALRKLHIPAVFVFTLDITLKYIVLLGELIDGLLTALLLRSVGKNDGKYNTVGGVMGVTFLRSAEMNQQMYEAMRCRGFTDDY